MSFDLGWGTVEGKVEKVVFYTEITEVQRPWGRSILILACCEEQPPEQHSWRAVGESRAKRQGRQMKKLVGLQEATGGFLLKFFPPL